MRSFGDCDVVNWCSNRRIESELPSSLFYKNEQYCRTFSLTLPRQFEQRLAVVRQLLYNEAPPRFGGALIFNVAVGITEDVVTERIYERMCISYGLKTGADSQRGILCESNEYEDCLALYAFAVVASWDAYFIPDDASYMLFTSNDGFIDIAARNPIREAEIAEATKGWEVRPLPDGPNTYCRS